MAAGAAIGTLTYFALRDLCPGAPNTYPGPSEPCRGCPLDVEEAPLPISAKVCHPLLTSRCGARLDLLRLAADARAMNENARRALHAREPRRSLPNSPASRDTMVARARRSARTYCHLLHMSLSSNALALPAITRRTFLVALAGSVAVAGRGIPHRMAIPRAGAAARQPPASGPADVAARYRGVTLTQWGSRCPVLPARSLRPADKSR